MLNFLRWQYFKKLGFNGLAQAKIIEKSVILFWLLNRKKTSSSSREIALTCDHKEADIRIILHGLEATKKDYDHIMVF